MPHPGCPVEEALCQAGTLSRDLESALKRPLILGVRGVGANRSLQVAVSGVGLWVPAAWRGGGLAGVGVMMVMVGDPPCWEMGGRVSLQGSRDQAMARKRLGPSLF